MGRIPIVLFLVIFSTISGQTSIVNRCGTTQYYQKKLGKTGYERFKRNLNDWLNRGISERRIRRTIGSTISIAVIVHILHQGQHVGMGTNLSATQVHSQIIVLNEDFNRLNTDTLNTPAVFQPVAAAVGIHFGLATIDPNNQIMEEPGIDRIKTNKEGYKPEEIDRLRARYTWDPDKYLNIFVVKIEGDDGATMAYANLPNNSTLAGINTTGNSFDIVDGIVIAPATFGSNYTKEGSIFKLNNLLDRGHTATHEVGHYLGLLHIWGDGDCSVDDFVADTPIAGHSHNNYNECQKAKNTCIEPRNDQTDMFQNYMDYTDDLCMNLFTKGQKERMLTALEKADHRRNLNTHYEKLTSTNPVKPTALPFSNSESDEGLVFYPNPTTGRFKFEINNATTGAYELKIINNIGQIVSKDNFVKQVQKYTYRSDASHLPNGIYFIILENKNYRRNIKFIISK